MTKEQLLALGLTEEQAKKAAEASQEELKSYIPKVRFDEVNGTKKQLESDLKDRDNQLTDLKKSTGDNEELKKQIETLQSDNKVKDEQYQIKLKDLQVSTAIKLAITGQTHDPDLIATLLDKSKIEVNDDGSVKAGLDDQIKSLRESKAFLFVEQKKEDQGFQFKGTKPAEGKGSDGDKGGEGDRNGGFGKRLAEMASKGNEGLSKARESYFKQ